MLKKFFLAALILSSVTSAFVFADTPVINKEMKSQKQRINKGVKQGKLTPAQAAALKQRLNYINREKQDMIRANGGKPLTPAQRQQLKNELNQSSKQIYQEKNPGAQ